MNDIGGEKFDRQIAELDRQILEHRIRYLTAEIKKISLLETGEMLSPAGLAKFRRKKGKK